MLTIDESEPSMRPGNRRDMRSVTRYALWQAARAQWVVEVRECCVARRNLCAVYSMLCASRDPLVAATTSASGTHRSQ